MKKKFSIGEAAEKARLTAETLRHYDRIGLVKADKDPKTKYRSYTHEDIVRLWTVRALQQMDLSLQEIKDVLAYEDLRKVLDFLDQAEKKADEKIAELTYSKSKIQLAKADYERKLQGSSHGQRDFFVQEMPQRVILLSDSLEEPSLENLWNYLEHFYSQLAPAERASFLFEDQAGMLTDQGRTRMFAVCRRYSETAGRKVLPAGRYLCADCTQEERDRTLAEALEIARKTYAVTPTLLVQLIQVSGILRWRYQLQLYLGARAGGGMSLDINCKKR